MLDKQINILSVDTGNFYSNREARLHWVNHKLRMERSYLVRRTKDIAETLSKYGIDNNDLESMLKDEYDYDSWSEEAENISSLGLEYCKIKNFISMKNKLIKKSKDALLLLLQNKIDTNIQTDGKHHIRELRNLNPSGDTLADIYKFENEPLHNITSKVISVFDSSFTRQIGAEQDNFTDDFMVVQVYYFDVVKDLIYYGFTYNDERYVYFTSSAGQIRTKKCVFVKESVLKKHEKTIMCGLSLDIINQKGGNNPNKHLAYMALSNSATDVWEEFDIDKSIVIDDFETDVYGTYDLVDETDYSVKRMNGYVPITHTDGAGMILPHMGKNRMVRIPWIKGLLCKFDYVEFIKENSCSPIIKDIYGKEHDVIAEGIEVIFTKSQFKMWKYYDSWEQYKSFYKKYECSAGYTNLEEERIRDATINYQMLQTLTDITDEEIDEVIKRSNDKLNNLCSSVNSMKAAFGITPYNMNMNHLQQAINLYPDLMNDEYVKITLREIKDSMVKRYKSGSLSVYGKYTFLLPDFYAACEYWFLGNDNPDGLLADGEVFCWLFRKCDKLDCLRSPHLYREHAVRKNTAYYKDKEKQERIRKWFDTDGIYTSCHDLISKILQFDVDGDKSLVIGDKKLIEIAERNMKGIVPLYYNMRKASPVQLNPKSIYEGLNAAFVGGNIGIYSNNISKIWNSEVFVSGTAEEKEHALMCIKRLCCQNNFVIDFAKTLYKPEFPPDIKSEIKEFTKHNVPHFFIYAKDKEEYQVDSITDSFVNKLERKIVNPRINCRSIGLKKIDYTLLVNNPYIECRVAFTKNGKIDVENTDPMIVKYCELNQKYHFKINMESADIVKGEILTNSQLKQDLFFKAIASEIRSELSKFGYSDSEIADILVKFLYYIKPSKHKSVLWFCYGQYIVDNLKKHCKLSTKTIQCEDCGEWFEVGKFNSSTCRCQYCQNEVNKINARLRKRKQRGK